ncbi:hypothetical protein, partial [Sphingomonas sp. ERG5]|uniref:hypothetical protein n=1 Tax=Sphingomonas sp. ERG5 TaxID=1381597 RepID=UPI003FA6EFC0
PGNGFSAIAAFRFRFAPPPGGNGNGGNNALTINTDHSVGAGQFCGCTSTQPGRDKAALADDWILADTDSRTSA